MADWDPDLYHRFRGYRAEPVELIFKRLTLERAERIVDLGCGTGDHTVELARRAPAAEALGIDSSTAMIGRASALRDGLDDDLRRRVNFEQADIRDFAAVRCFDLVFSNAAFQWLGNHSSLFEQCFCALRPGGMIAVQMPANNQEIAQVTIHALAHEPRWRAVLGAIRTPSDRSVQSPDEYHAMLSAIGFADIDCYYHNFRHPMRSPAEVIEWSRATVLRPYLDQLAADQSFEFIDELTRRLEASYGTNGALTFVFRRLFIFAHRTVNQAASDADSH